MRKKARNLSVVSLLLLDLFWQSYFRQTAIGKENSGVSFGIYPEISTWLVLLVWLGLVLVWWRSKKNFWLLLALVGSLSNLISRLVWGAVWDYLSLGILWVNLGDVMISLGLVSYILAGDGDKVAIRRREMLGDQ